MESGVSNITCTFCIRKCKVRSANIRTSLTQTTLKYNFLFSIRRSSQCPQFDAEILKQTKSKLLRLFFSFSFFDVCFSRAALRTRAKQQFPFFIIVH